MRDDPSFDSRSDTSMLLAEKGWADSNGTGFSELLNSQSPVIRYSAHMQLAAKKGVVVRSTTCCPVGGQGSG